jgi:hypothetical protein
MHTQSSQLGTGPTDADQQLALKATRLGPETVSAWQVKRWREAGLLATSREFRGRGRGSGPAEYPPQAAAHAACLAEVLDGTLTLDEACLVCFLRGFSPRERALKRAYAAGYARITKWVNSVAGGSDNPWTTADLIARMLSRRSAGLPNVRAAKSRLRAAGKRPSDLTPVLTNVLSGMLGASGRLHQDSLLALGMDGLRTPLGTNGPLADADDHELSRFSLAALAESVRASALAELEQARDDFVPLREVTVRFGSIVTRTHGLRLDQLDRFASDDLTAAFIGIPFTMIIRRTLGKERFDANLTTLKDELPRLRAMQRLLDELPSDVHRYFSMNATQIAALSDPELEHFRTAVRRYFTDHPEDEPLLSDTTDNNGSTDD